MNADIAKIIKSKIEGLNFIDKISGLVRPVTKVDVVEVVDENNEVVGENTIRTVFPVSCDISYDDCFNNEMYQDLVPNSDLRSLIYFEDRGINLREVKGELYSYTSLLRLVCWLNLNKFETTECSISAPVIAALIKAIPSSYFNEVGTPYQRIKASLTSIPPKNQTIFSQYSYKEETNQYLLYPYDYFALDLSVEFSIHESCIQSLTIKTPTCND